MSGAPNPSPGRGTMRRVAWQSALYTAGNVVSKLGGLLLAAVLWNEEYLPVAHYGRLDAAQNSVGAVLAAVLTFGLASSFLRFGTDPHEEGQRAVPFTAFVTVAALSGVALLLLWPWAGAIWHTFVQGNLEDATLRVRAPLLGRLVLVYATLKAIAMILLVRIQAKERPLLYGLATAGEFFVVIALTYGLLVHAQMGLEGALWALVAAASLQTTVLAGALLAQEERRFDAALARRMLRYGAPLIFGALALPLLHTGDRILLARLAAPADLTLYAAANRLASVVNVVLVQGFQVAFSVAGMKALTAGHGAALHRRTFRHLCVVGAGFALTVALFAQDVIAFLTPAGSVYFRAAPYVLPLAFGYFAYGLYIVGVNALYARGKTRRVALGVVLAALLNLALNVALVPLVGGAWGASLATLLAYGALAVGMARYTERLEGIRFPWAVMAVVLLLAVVIYVPGWAVRFWPTWPRLAVRAGLLALYPLVVLALGLYRRDELRRALDTLRALVRERLGRAG